jgi:diacylglycerol kinase family enzyme
LACRSQPAAAIRALADGGVEQIDVGKISWPESGESAYFMLMAGLGFDGEVTRLVNRKLKRFVGWAPTSSRRSRPPPHISRTKRPSKSMASPITCDSPSW